MKKIIAAAVALALLLAVGLWPTGGASETHNIDATASAVAQAESSQEVDELVAVDPPSQRADLPVAGVATLAQEPQGSEAIEAAKIATGSLLVKVISSDTELPIDAVGLSLTSTTTSRWYDSQSGPTDATGERRFHDVPAGRLKVAAWRTGASGDFAANEFVEIVAGETSELTLRLSGGETMFGRVVDELGRGVADAEIWLSQGNSGPKTSLLAGHSDAQGRFDIPHTMRIQAVGARAPGREPSIQKMPNHLKPEDPELGTRLVLTGLGGTLNGRVVARSGESIAGALVRIECLGPPRAGQPIEVEGGFNYAPAALMLRTDAQGAFATHTMGSGPFLITARGRETDVATVEAVVASGGQAEVELVVDGAGSMSGVVTDHLGKPVVGADLLVAGADWGFGLAEATTDEAGRFMLSALQTGLLNVTVVAGRGSQGVEQTVRIHADRDTTWNVSLPAPLTIVGSAFSTDGTALEGFHVRGSASGETGPMAEFQVNVQADGSFVAPNCLDADYDLALHLPGQWVGDPCLQLEAVHAGSVDAEFLLSQASLPTSSLAGSVVDEEGQPVPFRLVLQSHDPVVLISRRFGAPDGTFELPYLPPGQYELSFRAEGFVTAAFDLAPPLAENEVRALPGIRLIRQP